jgi:hypothetical protein
MKVKLCSATNQQRNVDIRGTFLVDNQGRLQTKMKRNENKEWIINYLYANPCAGLNECRKALLKWRGIRDCDDSRGQYSSYFYDHYCYKWYHKKDWVKFKDSKGKLRARLTIAAMAKVDIDFANKLAAWNKDGVERTKLWVDNPDDIENMIGYKYDDIIQ